MSRIERVMRELSDLREFQCKLERRHDATRAGEAASVGEEPSAYQREKGTQESSEPDRP